MDLLTGLNRDQGVTVVMVTLEAEMAACCKRVVRFRDGLVASDEPNTKEP
jgi:putative ABC transport system ATP-binding protein